MKSGILAVLAAVAVKQSAAHAIFQQLWVDGHGGQCGRIPSSNSPVTDVSSKDIVCNTGLSSAVGKCAVKAGSTVTVEMHQHADRSCTEEAIGGAHYGPVSVYLSKVSDAASADPSAGGWFKIFEDGWAKNPSGASGDDDRWGTKDLNTCCGRMDVKIPTDLANGDYLLRAEALALHSAMSSGGAQFYMTCFQLTVSGGSGSASPATVKFPGAYSASDPGILINIHAPLSSYKVPGPAVYSGGSTKTAGSACTGCESTCKSGSGPSGTVNPSQPTSPGGGGGGCTVAKFQQCGGTGYTGCTTCASGSTCSAVSPPYYYQCV